MDWTLCRQASLSTRLVLRQSRGRNGIQDVNTLYGLRHSMTTHCITKHQFSVSISQFTPGVQLQEYLNETPQKPLGASWQVQLFINFPTAGHGLWDSDRLAMATFRRCFLDVPQLQICQNAFSCWMNGRSRDVRKDWNLKVRIDSLVSLDTAPGWITVTCYSVHLRFWHLTPKWIQNGVEDEGKSGNPPKTDKRYSKLMYKNIWRWMTNYQVFSPLRFLQHTSLLAQNLW